MTLVKTSKVTGNHSKTGLDQGISETTESKDSTIQPSKKFGPTTRYTGGKLETKITIMVASEVIEDMATNRMLLMEFS